LRNLKIMINLSELLFIYNIAYSVSNVLEYRKEVEMRYFVDPKKYSSSCGTVISSELLYNITYTMSNVL